MKIKVGGGREERVHNCPLLGCGGPNGWMHILKKHFWQ